MDKIVRKAKFPGVYTILVDQGNLARFRGTLRELNPNAAPGLTLGIAAEGDVVLLAMSGKKPVGYYLLAKTRRGPKLDYVWVSPGWRGSGAGKRLEVKALEWARAEGGNLTRTAASTNKEEREAALRLERFSQALQRAGRLSGVHGAGSVIRFVPGAGIRRTADGKYWESAQLTRLRERRFRRIR